MSSSSMDVFLTAERADDDRGGTGGRGVFAFVLFSLTVVSLPLLLEKEIDFITAMLLSFADGAAEPVRHAGLGGDRSRGCLFVGMLPYFLGLLIVLPVLGHATWHLYRRALYDPV